MNAFSTPSRSTVTLKMVFRAIPELMYPITAAAKQAAEKCAF
jgi:hypothetical protein